MARVRMVTRTLELTIAEVMTLDIVTAEVRIFEYKLGGTFDNNESILKALRKTHETETFKLVSVTTTKVSTILYGMPEAKYIELAEVMPNR